MVTVTYSKRTTYSYKQNEFNFKDEVEMESNRTCAEVCFVKNPVNEKDALVFYVDIGSKDLVPIKSLKILKVICFQIFEGITNK